MNFFDQVILDNSIRNYAIVGSIIFIAVLVKKYLSRYIAQLSYRLIKREWRTIEEKVFMDLVVDPLKWFLFILITVFALDKLHFPQAFKFEIYEHSTNQILDRFGTGVIIVSFTWVLLRLINFTAVVLGEASNHATDVRDSQLIFFFRDFLKAILIACSILLIVKTCFNQHIGNLLTGLSIVGAALALAAKESLENLIASFIIFFDKPFFTGDTVNVNGMTGVIEKIGLRSTRIRTTDKTLVSVPNKQMVDSVVDNQSMRTYRRNQILLDLSVKNNPETVQAFIQSVKSLLISETRITTNTVLLKEISKDGFQVSIEYFSEPFSAREFNVLTETVNLAIIRQIKQSGIELASGSTNTIIVNNNAATS